MKERKYFKPKSMTWLASAVPLIVGCTIAAAPLHGWAALTETLRSMTGDIPPAVLINAGLAGIGIAGRTGKGHNSDA